MLSTENPPPDLREISQLKSVCSDERTSGNNQHQYEVDLFRSGRGDNNPLPKFSIRDYVLSKRGKNIKNNWPFSQKNLQLCLKHGVNDVLPPFQSLDSVRKQSGVGCAVENLRDSNAKHSELSNHSARKKLAVDIEKINSSESGRDKEFPSTTASQSCSDINPSPPSRSSCSEPEALHLPTSPKDKPEFSFQGPNNVESNIRGQVKKCRLIVKLNNIAEPKPNEDLAENASVVLEAMASKVCPVCKTFSSSSNTTLNAHIDQCLSGESSIKWTANSKVIKHRIKPRKTRLMVDIYETALCCTLEDLDKRNGTNWASNLGPSSKDVEAGAEKMKKRFSLVSGEGINEEGDVYIDSSGTKLRILSKPKRLPSEPNNKDDAATGFVKRDKGRKLISRKKKKFVVQKHMLHEHSFDGQRSYSPISNHLLECRPHGSNSCCHRLQFHNGQQKLFHSESFKKDNPMQPLVLASDQMKSDDFGMITKWVGSKRTGLNKKINLDRENHHRDRSMKNLRVKSVSSLGDTLSKGNTASIPPVSLCENLVIPTGSQKRKEGSLCNSEVGCIGPSSQRKRPALPLLNSQHPNDRKNHVTFSKFNTKQSRKDLSSANEHNINSPNATENQVASQSDKKWGISSILNENDDCSFVGSKMSQHHRILSPGKKFTHLRKTFMGQTKKFSSLRTKLLSLRHASVTDSKTSVGRKLLKLKKFRLHYTSSSDEEEAIVSRSTCHRQDNLVEAWGRNETLLEKNCCEPLVDRNMVLKIQKKIRGVRNTCEEDLTTSDSLETSPEYSDNLSVGKNVDSFTGGSIPIYTSCDLGEEAEMADEFVTEPTYGITNGEVFVSLSKSVNSAFPVLADSSNVECGSHFYDGHCQNELVLNADHDHVVAEIDGGEGQGNYFVDVDPIPIPGPPGSFLPSPGRMCSEELQGLSSLTTCRIQSSEEGHEVADMDSSDSPISAISAVSNSAAARSNPISITNLSEQSHFQHEARCNISEDRSGPVVKVAPLFEQVVNADRELNLLESRSDLMLPEAIREAQNVQPCCCSRKDGYLQGGSSDYQDSQILRRRTLNSPVFVQEKQMSNNLKNEIHCVNFRSETHSKKEPTQEPEELAANSPMGYAPLLVSHNSETMFRTCADCDSPSSSNPNPILRLMGKNLMVVNKDENQSFQTRPTQSSIVIDHPGSRLCAENGLSTTHNELNSFHHNLSRGPSTSKKLQPGVPAQHFDFNSSDGFKIPANCGPPPFSTYPSAAMFSGTNFGGNVASRCNGYPNGFNLITDQLGSKVRLDPQTTYDTAKVCTPIHRLRTAESSGKHKDVIIINDSPDSEAGVAVNPFYSYETWVYPRFTGSPTAPTGNTSLPPSKGMSANFGKWNCIPESSSTFCSNSSSASLPSTAQLRSSAYFSPGFL